MKPQTKHTIPFDKLIIFLPTILLLLGIFFVMALPRVIAADARHAAAGNIVETGKAFSGVAKEADPSVVFIQVEKKMKAAPMFGLTAPGDGSSDPFGGLFKRFFQGQVPDSRGDGREYSVSGAGSGFIASKDGYILTNNHVVSDADKITVTLSDGRELKGKVVGTDPRTDLAVIKVDADDLPVLPLGDSDSLEPGEWVVAVGSPFGLTHSITAGIVSAIGRTHVGIADYEDFIQTDAAINPGNSGGPLLDLEGHVVGINTAIYTRTGSYMGVGFAIPINLAKKISDQLIKDGSVTRGYLGVLIQELSPALAKSFDLREEKGILVSQVESDSPAEKAGLKEGDVIVGLDGEDVAKVGPFRNTVAMYGPGKTIDLTVVRDGKKMSFEVCLGRLSDQGPAAAAGQGCLEPFGVSIQELDPALAERFGYQGEQGVLISQVDPQSLAARAGLRPGTLIKEVDRQPVASIADIEKAMKNAGSTDSVLLLVQDGRYSKFLVLERE
jgi:serine protease Do